MPRVLQHLNIHIHPHRLRANACRSKDGVMCKRSLYLSSSDAAGLTLQHADGTAVPLDEAEAWDRNAVNGNGSVVLLQYTQPRGALLGSEKRVPPPLESVAAVHAAARCLLTIVSSILLLPRSRRSPCAPVDRGLLDLCPCDTRPDSASKPTVLA